MNNKKGVSQLVATVLLIAMVIAITAIIFFWVRGFISEQIEKSIGGVVKPVEQVCDEISFNAELQELQGKTYLYIFNKGNVPISDFAIKIYDNTGNSKVLNLGSGVAAGSSQMFSLSSTETETLQSDIQNQNTVKVIVIPDLTGYIKGTSKMKSFSCDEKTLGKLVKGG